MRNRIVGMAMLALLAGASSAWAILDCADYISGSDDDGPLTGSLIGEQLVTEEFAFGVDAGVSAGLRGTVQYHVGFYRMSNGHTYSIDCRTYTMA